MFPVVLRAQNWDLLQIWAIQKKLQVKEKLQFSAVTGNTTVWCSTVEFLNFSFSVFQFSSFLATMLSHLLHHFPSFSVMLLPTFMSFLFPLSAVALLLRPPLSVIFFIPLYCDLQLFFIIWFLCCFGSLFCPLSLVVSVSFSPFTAVSCNFYLNSSLVNAMP